MDIILVWDQLETERLFFSSWFATDARTERQNSAVPYQAVMAHFWHILNITCYCSIDSFHCTNLGHLACKMFPEMTCKMSSEALSHSHILLEPNEKAND